MRSLIQLSLICLLALLIVGIGQAKDVGGPIVVDTVWKLADSPFRVVRSVLVTQGVTLTIEPGVIVKFEPNLAFQVDGQLIAQGTESKTIIFTSNKADPAPGDWGYIHFSDTSVDAVFSGETYVSGCIMQYCAVEYNGGTGASGAVWMQNSSPYINHSIIRNNAKTGIYVSGSGSKPKINLNRIEKNSTSNSGIYVYYSTATITGNSISQNTGD
jgi:hypothetical protein